jgi:hypothetical protein
MDQATALATGMIVGIVIAGILGLVTILWASFWWRPR